MSPVHLFKIASSQEALEEASAGYTVWNNVGNYRDDWREYWPIRKFLLGENLDPDAYYGFLSPRFPEKIGLGHAQISEFVRAAGNSVDVVLFSPQPDMGAFFLNIFEQEEVFQPGFIAASEAFFAQIGMPIDLRSLVMDSRRIVFSNYFIARPAYWQEWLGLNEKLFALCEGNDSPLKELLTFKTGYPGAVQRKVFLMERIASLLLTLNPRWKVRAYNTFNCAWSGSGLNQFKHEAVLSDALKMAISEQGFPQYREAFAELREKFRHGASRTGLDERSIDTLHRSKVGKVSDKWDSYLSYYDTLFGHLRRQAVSLLEIGVQNGGSLETWSHYFSSGTCFVGCDINPKCQSLEYVDKRIHVVVGDANSNDAFQTIRRISSAFDIVIDDGSHVSNDILNAFINYFPLVKPGGLYVIEDTHTLYMDNFGGGILHDYSAYAFFKKLIDVINFQFWKDQVSINTYFRTFFATTATPSFILEGWVDSVEFRNSMITVRKSLTASHEKLGARLISGTVAQVEDWQGSRSTGS